MQDFTLCWGGNKGNLQDEQYLIKFIYSKTNHFFVSHTQISLDYYIKRRRDHSLPSPRLMQSLNDYLTRSSFHLISDDRFAYRHQSNVSYLIYKLIMETRFAISVQSHSLYRSIGCCWPLNAAKWISQEETCWLAGCGRWSKRNAAEDRLETLRKASDLGELIRRRVSLLLL